MRHLSNTTLILVSLASGLRCSSRLEDNCDNIYNRAEEIISANQACASSDDCTSMITNCGLPSGCWTIINKRGAVLLHSVVDQWASSKCAPPGTCKPCPMAPEMVACLNGACAAPQP